MQFCIFAFPLSSKGNLPSPLPYLLDLFPGMHNSCELMQMAHLLDSILGALLLQHANNETLPVTGMPEEGERDHRLPWSPCVF